MLTIHQPLFEHLSNRKTKSDCIIFGYVATRDEEVETDDHYDGESILQAHILTNKDQISLLSDLTVCPSWFFQKIT